MAIARDIADGAGFPPVPARNWALFLDVDGTLLDLAATPDAVRVPFDLPPLLAALAAALDGALALVSGRTLAWLDRAFAPFRFAAAGEHGAELRAPGCERHADPAVAVPAALGAEIGAAFAARPGVLVEPKRFGVAVHFRAAPEAADAVHAALAEIVARHAGRYELLAGHMVAELRPRGVSKGHAVAALLAQPPFAGRRPVVAGDDRTDEDGFRAALARGGLAIQVGPSHSQAATHFVADPAALRAWLAGLPARLAECAA